MNKEKEFWDHLITNHKEDFVKELDLIISLIIYKFYLLFYFKILDKIYYFMS